MAGEWMQKDDWDRIEALKEENQRLQAELTSGRVAVTTSDGPIVYSLLRADIGDVWRLLDDVRQPGETAPAAVARLMGEREALRERAEWAQRERNAIMTCAVKLQARLWTGDSQDRSYDARALVAVREKAGLDAAPADSSGG